MPNQSIGLRWMLPILALACLCASGRAEPAKETTSIFDFNGKIATKEYHDKENVRIVARVDRDFPKEFKPYVQAFSTPSGINVLRDQVADHIHHHALMYAIRVDGVNFWEEIKGSGYQDTSGYVTEVVDTDRAWKNTYATFGSSLSWNLADRSHALLKEKRVIAAFDPKENGASLISWSMELRLPDGVASATLSGSHYFGLGMRFVEEMDDNGVFENASGEVGENVRGTEYNVPARWCAYRSEVNGTSVTVAMFDHPLNPRHPATWFTMTAPFAYMSATMNLIKEPMVRTKPMAAIYGVALWDGNIATEEIEKLYQKWVKNEHPGKHL